MKATETNGNLMISLEGRIDTNSAPVMEQEIMDIINANAGKNVSFDADNLEYISSSGLRMIMRVRKKLGYSPKMINVSQDVYDIFETTGFNTVLELQKKLREISVEGCEKLGEGGNGAVYRLDDDKIVKVYKPWMKLEEIEKERGFAKTAFINGIPSVIAYDTVKVGDSLGIVFELLKSDTLGRAMKNNPEKLEEYVDQYVELAKALHATHVPEDSFTHIQDVLSEMADNLGQWCTEDEIALLKDIIAAIPESDTVTHNDLHPGNIMIQDGELVLIDMPQVTMGPPICDLVAIYRDMIAAPKTATEFIEGSVGMPADLIIKAGTMFFQKYTGITDPAELEAYFKKMGLLYSFNVSLVPGSKSERAMERAEGIMEHLLRPIVIPNAETIKMLYKTL